MEKKGLIPNSARSREELVANGRKGGLKAAERKRKVKELRALLNDFLSTPVQIKNEIPEEIVAALKAAGYKDITLKERGALLMAYKMSLGDLRAALLVSKMIGEYTEEVTNADVEEGDSAIVITVADKKEAKAIEEAYAERIP